jgi:glutamyl-tRNA reductase
MKRYVLLGLNHKTAPLDVRERLALGPDRRREAMARFHERFNECEAVVLSTCNRVELYTARAVHGHPRAEELVEFLSAFQNLPADVFRAHLYEKVDRDMIEHLFGVASSLDSMVLGETQILGQVREAYDEAQQLTSAGPMLNPLFQRAIAVGKQVMNETRLAEGRRSVASVAVEFARRIFDTFDNKTVLSIGAGKMSTLVLKAFAQLKPGKLLVCNRDLAKAQALAQRFAGEPVSFEALADHLAAADVVLTGTGSMHPIITAATMERVLKARRYRPMFLIDIALPRDVEASVAEMDNVYLYNLDDLQGVVSKTMSNRSGAIEAARLIVTKNVDEFLRSERVREMGPLIERLYKRYHDIAAEELNRTLGKLPNVSVEERTHLEDLTRRIVNKLLHDPIQSLRHTDAQHNNAAQYVHALEKLFQIEDKSDSTDES